ncbi:hypothetical protein GCM10007198_06420 [Microbacterium aerolatum]|uniref:Tyr recombinase domain-containing protein n=1 Tax=Microbacterium aerolatum TaxID=153731 RepID=A0A511AL98_9MICO|nr:hypothetical protein MAE01_18230 [Microbacterium aerolatum]GGB18608.1 hypothetical protein GCM10007198_06420 [Microbacterium aerolatum]
MGQRRRLTCFALLAFHPRPEQRRKRIHVEHVGESGECENTSVCIADDGSEGVVHAGPAKASKDSKEWNPTLRSASSPASGFLRQRAALKYCAAFLREIRSQQETLATFPQRRLDAYLTDSPSQRDALAPFTRWLRKHRLSTVRVEFRSHRLEGRDYASDHRWQMARRFLSAADMDPKTRAAGLLVLLYGIQLTRIVTITRAQVDTNSRPVTLTVGAEPIELPEILGNAMVNLVAASARHPEGWLFPGRNPGKHLTPGPLSRRLRAEGLLTGSARTTALIELTRQMHPRIVSDLLGITTASAAAWSRLAGGEWSDYPALRSTHA